MCLIVVIIINMLGAGQYIICIDTGNLCLLTLTIYTGAYGECEFIFASIKVITITAVIVRAPSFIFRFVLNINLSLDTWYCA